MAANIPQMRYVVVRMMQRRRRCRRCRFSISVSILISKSSCWGVIITSRQAAVPVCPLCLTTQQRTKARLRLRIQAGTGSLFALLLLVPRLHDGQPFVDIRIEFYPGIVDLTEQIIEPDEITPTAHSCTPWGWRVYLPPIVFFIGHFALLYPAATGGSR